MSRRDHHSMPLCSIADRRTLSGNILQDCKVLAARGGLIRGAGAQALPGTATLPRVRHYLLIRREAVCHRLSPDEEQAVRYAGHMLGTGPKNKRPALLRAVELLVAAKPADNRMFRRTTARQLLRLGATRLTHPNVGNHSAGIARRTRGRYVAHKIDRARTS